MYAEPINRNDPNSDIIQILYNINQDYIHLKKTSPDGRTIGCSQQIHSWNFLIRTRQAIHNGVFYLFQNWNGQNKMTIRVSLNLKQPYLLEISDFRLFFHWKCNVLNPK